MATDLLQFTGSDMASAVGKRQLLLLMVCWSALLLILSAPTLLLVTP